PATYFPSYLSSSFTSYQSGAYDDALATLEPIKTERTFGQRRPSPEKLYLLAGLCQLEKGDFEATLAAVKNGAALRGSNAELSFLAGLVYGARGELDKARQSFEESSWFGRSTVSTPDIVMYAIGLTYRLQENTVKANASFTASAASNPAF